MTKLKLDRLKDHFPENHIEWRIAQSGTGAGGKPWGIAVAYISARAIMDRLDEVVGPENWTVDYRFESNANMKPGIICQIGIKCDDKWVYKADGADQTDTEAFKGGLSGALKRAGSAWGIGRYLYDLEQDFVQTVEKGTQGAKYAKTKEGSVFYWIPPRLPAWALPANKEEKEAIKKESPLKPLKEVTSKVNTPKGVQPREGYPVTFGISQGAWQGTYLDKLSYEEVLKLRLEIETAQKQKTIPPQYMVKAAELLANVYDELDIKTTELNEANNAWEPPQEELQ